MSMQLGTGTDNLVPTYYPQQERVVSSDIPPVCNDGGDNFEYLYWSFPNPLRNESKNANVRHSYSCHWLRCSSSFSSPERLHDHVKTHTTRLKIPSPCKWAQCNRTFISRSSLNKHLKTHTKPFQCIEPSCSYSAANRRDMQRHSKTHGIKSGDVLFGCPLPGCDQEHFKRLDNAKRHMRRKHPGLSIPPISIVI